MRYIYPLSKKMENVGPILKIIPKYISLLALIILLKLDLNKLDHTTFRMNLKTYSTQNSVFWNGDFNFAFRTNFRGDKKKYNSISLTDSYFELIRRTWNINHYQPKIRFLKWRFQLCQWGRFSWGRILQTKKK